MTVQPGWPYNELMCLPSVRSLTRLALAASLLITGQTVSADDSSDSFTGALSGGSFKALLRYNAMYRNSTLHMLQDSSEPIPPETKTQQYSAFGGYFGYETASWMNFSAGATVYTSQPIGNNPDSRRGLGGLYEQDGGQDGYTALGEAFLRYQIEGHRVTAGRQEMPAYRMVSLSNIRMTPVTHSGIAYDNSVVDGLKFSAAYITKMKERNDTRFIDMARGARLQVSSNGKQLIRGEYDPADYDETGYIGSEKSMAMAGAVYSRGRFSVEAWNYHVEDFVNSLYLYGDYRFDAGSGPYTYTIAAQYTDQRDVGGHIGGNIDTWNWGLSLRAISNTTYWFVNYDEVAYNQNSYDGGTLFVRWGTPQMFNSFQVQDSELAGVKSWGAGMQYDFGLNGILPGVVMRWRYGIYDMPDALHLTDARQDRSEATFDLRYSFTLKSGFGIFTEIKGLSLQFRAAWNNYDTSYDFEAYREIHGYEFESVTKDFWDLRLYLDYHF
jgi:hypothetical protein